jgi:surfactin synthase thioesterase subunit
MHADPDRTASRWFRPIRRQANPETCLVCSPREVAQRLGSVDESRTDPEALVNPEFRQLFLPVARAYYRMIAGHRITVKRVIDAPVVAYYGDQNEDIEKSISTRSTLTSSTFTARRFNGGHFYLIDHAQDLIADLFTVQSHKVPASDGESTNTRIQHGSRHTSHSAGRTEARG